MQTLAHLVTEPDHLMWALGLAALLIGKANRGVTVIYAVIGLAVILGHAVITGA